MKGILYQQFELQVGSLCKDGGTHEIKSRQVEVQALGRFPYRMNNELFFLKGMLCGNQRYIFETGNQEIQSVDKLSLR
jgi:hypothetical protein